MATVRVFLLTYRRPQLLRRAVKSLCAQTFTDWVCELHNDAPDDPFPRELVAEIGDPRITLHQHSTNWGATASFNHVFIGGPETYASLLEDDNWWEPGFLRAALQTIETHPDASLVWANMYIWREEADGRWTDTGKTIWRHAPGDISPRTFHWPEAIQAFNGLHSNGAMVFRPCTFQPISVTALTPLSIIEPMRERTAQGDLLLLPVPLANFAMTRETSRSRDPVRWLQSQLLVATSFFEAVKIDPESLKKVWATQRAMTPRDTNLLFLTAIALRRPSLLRPATLNDWLRFVLNVGRHPICNLRGLRFRHVHVEVWTWLRQHTLAASLRTSPLLVDKHAPPQTS